MSYYNYILKMIKINEKDIEKYIDEDQDDYSVFFESSKDFDKLKNVVGVSCSSSDGDIIVLKTVREGSVMIRPRDLKFPYDTFYGEAGCFIILKDINSHLNKEISDDKDIQNGIKDYLKYVSPKCEFIIMAY